MVKQFPELSKIEEAINKARLGWTLCFISESQSKKLATLTQDLRGKVSTTGNGKQITSGFSYWGIGPSIAWTHACNDPFYPVMKEGIESFPDRWLQILPSLDHQNYHYVSLGVGTGHKDCDILRDLYKMNSNLFYFPVDMSSEMLRIGVQEASRGTSLQRRQILPIQLDFSINRNVEDCQILLSRIVGDEPILFSLLGNTLANFEKDTLLLKTLSRLIRPQDRLLLEVAYTDDLNEEAAQEGAAEYSKSRLFREFVTSALLQNTDLHLSIDDVSFTGIVEQNRAIQIKALYHNRTGSTVNITLPDRTYVEFPSEDTIRLYLTRKYTSRGIETLLSNCGFSALDRERSVFDPIRSHFNFGTELMLLIPLSSCSSTTHWQSAFISYGAPDQEFAAKLNKALTDRGIRTFFFSLDGIPGEKAHNMMRKGINEFDRTILICSQRSLERLPVLNELDLVLERESREGGSQRLLPVTLDRYLYDDWRPKDRNLKKAVLTRNVCNFIDADYDDTKFDAAFQILMRGLKSSEKEKQISVLSTNKQD